MPNPPRIPMRVPPPPPRAQGPLPPLKRTPALPRARGPDAFAGLEYSDQRSIEDDQKRELAALGAAYRAEEQKQRDSVGAENDAGYYSVLVFENTAQSDAFLNAIQYTGDDAEWIDGRHFAAFLADLLGASDEKRAEAAKALKALPKAERMPRSPKIDASLAALSRGNNNK